MLKNSYWILLAVFFLFISCHEDNNDFNTGSQKVILKDANLHDFFKGKWIYTSFRLSQYPGRFVVHNKDFYEFEIGDSTFKINDEIGGKWKLYRDNWYKYIHFEIQNQKYKKLIFNEEDLRLLLYDIHPQLFDAIQYFTNMNGKIIGISHHFLRSEEAGAWITSRFPERYNDSLE